ncbi:uridylate kinase [Actinoplanes sp. TRM 88003]|uniref:Uridylate kinase n=1 Tax=Paractinoplanes aksuensis TaxID=2939490 RepID=A0ABT1DFD7_9ACTN|nr:uridylate kinase [Actinoplanes aksuensis]MCO8269543.1 uridylate kinase [Actinoplanes aksuensis]
MIRDEMLSDLSDLIGSVTRPHPVRVAIDGRPAAGKTTLADELGAVLRARGREVIRTSIDNFLRPRADRYRRGEFSIESNYHDSFDFDALHQQLLGPLGPGGNRRYRGAVRDRVTDVALTPPWETARPDAVLLFDGVFLMRPELDDHWDLRVLVATSFGVTLDRARVRDEAEYGSAEIVERRFEQRYRPTQQYYADTVRPAERADVVVHNDTPARPSWDVRL